MSELVYIQAGGEVSESVPIDQARQRVLDLLAQCRCPFGWVHKPWCGMPARCDCDVEAVYVEDEA